MGCFFPLDSHPMVHFIKSKIHGFPYQFPITWQNAVKSIGRAWEIATHFFPNVWVLFFHQMPILWYTLPHGECMVFPINY